MKKKDTKKEKKDKKTAILPPSVGINLNDLNYWTQWSPRTNLACVLGGNFGYWDNSIGGTAAVPCNAQGFPTTNGFSYLWNTAITDWGTGNYIFLWNGNGTLNVAVRNSSNEQNIPSGVATIVPITAGNTMILSYVGSGMTSLSILPPGQTTDTWSPHFLAKLAPFSIIRTMDWSKTNGSSVVNWADRA